MVILTKTIKMPHKYQKDDVVYWSAPDFPGLEGFHVIMHVHSDGDIYRIDNGDGFTDVNEDEIVRVEYTLYTIEGTGGMCIIVPSWEKEMIDFVNQHPDYQKDMEGSAHKCIQRELEIMKENMP